MRYHRHEIFEKLESPIPKEILNGLEVESSVRTTRTHIHRSSGSLSSPEELEQRKVANLKLYIKRYKRKLDIWTGVRCDQQ